MKPIVRGGNSEFADSVSNSTDGEFDNGTSVVTVYIGIGVAILIALTAIVVVVLTLVLLYLRKSSPQNRSQTMIHIQHYAEETISHTHSDLLLTCMTRFN